MGRTLPTFNQALEDEIAAWSKFRRALRKEDQPALDRLFARAKKHTAAGAAQARPIMFESMILAMLVEQEKEIERLHARKNREPETSDPR